MKYEKRWAGETPYLISLMGLGYSSAGVVGIISGIVIFAYVLYKFASNLMLSGVSNYFSILLSLITGYFYPPPFQEETILVLGNRVNLNFVLLILSFSLLILGVYGYLLGRGLNKLEAWAWKIAFGSAVIMALIGIIATPIIYSYYLTGFINQFSLQNGFVFTCLSPSFSGSNWAASTFYEFLLATVNTTNSNLLLTDLTIGCFFSAGLIEAFNGLYLYKKRDYFQ